MERISLFALLVLIVFLDLSVATPPMLSGCGFSSLSAGRRTERHEYDLNYLMVQLRPEGATMYKPSKLIIKTFRNDPTTFEYSIVCNDEQVFQNTGRNTNVEFYFGNKLKIHAKDNDSVVYSLDFELPFEAALVADRILRVDPRPYKKCNGDHSFKIDRLHLMGQTTNRFYWMGDNFCIFMIFDTNLATFMIRELSEREYYRIPLCIFRSNDYSLTPVPNESNKLELRISLGGVIMKPSYALETSTPDQMQAFFTRESPVLGTTS